MAANIEAQEPIAREDSALSNLKPWLLPEKSIFFRSTAEGQWDKTLAEDREWILVGDVSAKLFDALSPADVTLASARGYEEIFDSKRKAELQTQALTEWKVALRPEWIPAAENIVVASLKRRGTLGRSREAEFFASASFQGKGWRALVFGTLGQGFNFYLEQPNPLLAGTELVLPAQIVRTDVTQALDDTAFPKVQWSGRELKRVRAFTPQGPYEPVRILLMRFRLPQSFHLPIAPLPPAPAGAPTNIN